jgi:DNA-binding NarL/FixJ family response regulator
MRRVVKEAVRKTNQQIATEIGKAVGTVKNALHALFKELDVQNRSAPVARQRR